MPESRQDIPRLADIPNLPRYVCNKVVRAAHITEVRWHGPLGEYRIAMTARDMPAIEIKAPKEWVDHFGPKAGMYFVVYNDGYCSVSPAEAFEEGYTLQE